MIMTYYDYVAIMYHCELDSILYWDNFHLLRQWFEIEWEIEKKGEKTLSDCQTLLFAFSSASRQTKRLIVRSKCLFSHCRQFLASMDQNPFGNLINEKC